MAVTESVTVAEGIELYAGHHYTATADVVRSEGTYGPIFVAVLHVNGPGCPVQRCMGTEAASTADQALSSMRLSALQMVHGMEAAYEAGRRADVSA